jgi:hypothetical protein
MRGVACAGHCRYGSRARPAAGGSGGPEGRVPARGRRPRRRPQDHACRTVPAGCTRGTVTRGTGARGYAARRSATRGSTTARTGSHRTGRPEAQAGDRDTGTRSGTAKPSVTCTDRSSVTCTSSQCHRGPIRRERLPPRLADQPRRSSLREQPLPPPQARSGQNLLSGYASAQAAPRTGRPARARIAGSSRVRTGRRVKPCPPQTGHRACGAVATAQPVPGKCSPGWPAPWRNRPRAGFLSLPATGRNQLPGISCFPIACYGLTPRCREVKR